MKKSFKIAIIIALCTLLTIVGVFSTLIVHAWFSNVPRVYTSDQDSGQIARIGMRINLLFERLRPDDFSGTITYSEGVTATFDSSAEWGTAANPYIISLPRHMINLYALQRIGYFEERYISKNYNEGTYITDSSIMPYFLVCDTDGTPICVNGNINGSRTEIQPIGNDEYPFIGVIGGAQKNQTSDPAEAPNEKTSISSVIANFDVVAKEGDVDVGLFGKIGYLGVESGNAGDTFNGAISYVNDLLLYDVKIVSKNTTIVEQIANHIFSKDIDTANSDNHFEEDHHVGILAGHIEYASVTNISVYYSSTEIIAIDVDDSGANYLSDSGFIGLIYNLNPEVTGNAIGSSSGTTIAGNVQGAGEEWGGSIDMRTIFNRLQSTLTAAKSYTPQTYPVAETVYFDEATNKEISRTVTEYGTYTTVSDSTETGNIEYYYSTNGGSFVFADYTNSSSSYALFHGKSMEFWPKTVTTITLKNATENGFTIESNSNYLNASHDGTTASLSSGVNGDTASVWILDNSGKLYTYLDTNPSNIYTADGSQEYMVKYYLNADATGALSVSTIGTTIWTTTTENDVGTLSYTNTDTHTWYLRYSAGWACYPFLETFTISEGSNDYMSNSGTDIVNGTAANALQFSYENGKILTLYNGSIHYLTATGDELSLTTSQPSFNWTKTADTLTYSADGKTWYLRFDNGKWDMFPSTTAYTFYSGSDYISVSGTDLTVTSQQGATKWMLDGTKLYTVVNGQTWYLKGSTDGSGQVSLVTGSANATSWSFSTNGAPMTFTDANNVEWFLFEQGTTWKVYSVQQVSYISYGDHFIRLVDSPSTAIIGGTENEASPWLITGGQIETELNGVRYYLNSSGTTVFPGSTATTTWTYNGTNYLNDNNWYLVYDEGWYTYPALSYTLISDGTNYLSFNGTNGVANQTTSTAATRWFADGNRFYAVSGTSTTKYYLTASSSGFGISTTPAEGTEFSYDETEKRLSFSNGSYYAVYNNGWVVTTTPETGNYVVSGRYYLYTDGSSITTQNANNTNNQRRWTFNKSTGKVYTTINGTKYYLQGQLATQQLRSTTNLNVTTNVNAAGTTWNYVNSILTCDLQVNGEPVTYTLTFENNTWKLMDLSRNYYTVSSNNATSNYMGTNSNTSPSIQNITDASNATLWSFSDDSVPANNTASSVEFTTTINGIDYYLVITQNSGSNYHPSLSTQNTTIEYYHYYTNRTNYYCLRRNSSGYYIDYYRSNWILYSSLDSDAYLVFTKVNFSETSVSLGAAFFVEEQLATLNSSVTISANEALGDVEYEAVTIDTGHTFSTGSVAVSDTFDSKTIQVTSKKVTREAGGHDTYFPLVADDTAPFAVNSKNTGYIVGGSHATYQQASGDVRVASYYAFTTSTNNGTQYYLQNSLSSSNSGTYRRDRLEVVTRTYLSNGYVRILDNYNGSNTPRKALSNKFGTTRYSDESLGLKKYDSARDQLHEMFVPDGSANTTYTGSIYGMHFMDAAISMENMITAPKVVINGQTYTDYQMPEDCIDFRLKSKGYINFFAGTYYLNTGYTNNCFFSLNQIFRNSDNEITAIKRISKIYGVPDNDKKAYIYLYGDGTYSKGNSSPVGVDGYVEMFDTDWIERPDSQNGYLERTLYYFEVPVNSGEYALGSVETKSGETARYGAYLCYLDIGASAADHTSELGSIDFVHDNLNSKIVVVPDTNENDTSLNYYVPSLVVLFTNNNQKESNAFVEIGAFTVKVRRTISSTSDAHATVTTVFGGADEEYLEALVQVASMGDALSVSHVDGS